MKVHVVAQRLHADRILPRLARYLAAWNGWTVSHEPDNNADANYFCNYLTWRTQFNGWNNTWTSAFFTHKDLTIPLKGQYWDDAARFIDQAIICARRWARYLPAGKIAYARAPVEVERFVIRQPPRAEQPIVGFSGFVYHDGRKGEALVKRLVRDKLAQRLTFRASGRGWPVPTKGYSWGDMPAFYQGLNVLAIVASNEGIPMPPLEALACGVKIVIPTDCGMLDELPDIDGIYRYANSDYASFIGALQRAAFGGPVDRKAMRDIIIADYTVPNWCEDHKRAIEAVCPVQGAVSLYTPNVPAVPEGPLPDWHGTSGIYAVAFGEPSRECARKLIGSVRKHMPGLPVCLVSTKPLGGETIFVEQRDSDIGGRIAKLKAYELAPAAWRYVLYLDADIELVQPIDYLFQLLQDGWEMAICKDMNRYHTANMMLRPDNTDEAHATWAILLSPEGSFQYNGGMMAFRRSEATRDFFRSWQTEWQKYGKRDQGALLRALYGNPLRLYLLGNQWNASDRYPTPDGEIAVWHHNTQARRWGGLIKGRIDSPEAWAAVETWKARKGRAK